VRYSTELSIFDLSLSFFLLMLSFLFLVSIHSQNATMEFYELGGLAPLVALLDSDDVNVQKNAIHALNRCVKFSSLPSSSMHQSSSINQCINHHQSSIINHQSSIIDQSSKSSIRSSIINHQSSNHQSSTFNHQIINHQQHQSYHQSSTIILSHQ